MAANHASHPKLGEPQRSLVFGVLLYLCVHSLTQSDYVRQTRGEGYVFAVSHASHPKRAGHQRSNFGVSLLLMQHVLTENDHVLCGERTATTAEIELGAF